MTGPVAEIKAARIAERLEPCLTAAYRRTSVPHTVRVEVDDHLETVHPVGSDQDEASLVLRIDDALPNATPAQLWRFGAIDDVALCPPLDLADAVVQPVGPIHEWCDACWIEEIDDTPFGTLRRMWIVSDGRLTWNSVDERGSAPARLRTSLRRCVRVRSGAFDPLQCVGRDGGVFGDLVPLMQLGGILASPAWVRARRISDRRASALLVMASLMDYGLARALCD